MAKTPRAARRVPMDVRLRWLRAIGRTALGGATTYRVAIFIAWQIDGRLMHSIGSIARDLGISYNSADRGVHALVEAGLLVRERSPTPHSPATYRIAQTGIPILGEGDAEAADGSPGLEKRPPRAGKRGPQRESSDMGNTEGDSEGLF